MASESDYNNENESDSDASVNDPVPTVIYGPWFTVVDPNTFTISRLPDFTASCGPVDFDSDLKPYDYFQKFLNDEDCCILDVIVEETNRYAHECLNVHQRSAFSRGYDWKQVTKDEMSAFFGLVFAMGIVRKPTYASYWETGSGDLITETPNFSQVMSRNRFQSILRFLHCNDNNLTVPRGRPGFDPLHKVRPIIDFFNGVFEKNYRLSQNVCIDERIIGFKGRHFLKRYIANKKAHRWGVKAWILAESNSGYTHHVQIYQGNHNSPNHPHGQGYKVVMDLMRPHFSNLHHVTIDSWFTSPKLLHDLRNRGIFGTGTVITTRKGMPSSFKKARLPKGDMIVKSQGPLMAVLYSDRRHVTVLSTTGSSRMIRKANSKGKIVKAPGVVHKYNETIGGVDLGDQLMAQYEPQFRSIKFWKKIFFSFLMMAAVNAYICYKFSFMIRKKMDHLQFQKEIVMGLLGNFREGRSKRGCMGVLRCARLTAKHFIDLIPGRKRMRCAVCAKRGRNFAGTRIGTWCPDCSVGLCVGNCFKKFHNVIDYEE